MAVSTRRSRVRSLPLLAAVAAVVFASPARADEAAGANPDELVKLRYEWHKQQARQEAADEEAKWLAKARAGTAGVRSFQNPTTILTQLRPELARDYETMRNGSLRAVEAAKARREEARKEWEEVYKQRIAFRQYTDEQQKIYKFDFDTGAQPPFKPEVYDAIVVGWAALVFVVAVRMGKRVRRVSLRKFERAAAAVVLVSLLGASGCSGGAAPDGRPWTVREQAKLVEENKDAKEKALAAVAGADKRWAATLDGWTGLVAAPGTPEAAVQEIVRDGETEIHKNLREASEESRLAERLATEAADERAQLAADKTRLGELTLGAKVRTIAYTGARCAFAAALFGLAVSPYWRARRQESARVKADAKKCPQCFSERLVVIKTGAPPEDDEDDPRSRRGKPKYKPKVKKVVEEEEDAPTETGYVECKKCSFRFLRSYLKVHRLCFPVVGVRASGKTQMLATGYDRVRKRTAPTAAVVQPAPSLGDQQFEAFIDLLMNMKQGMSASVHAMPSPVMLHVRDADPDGGNTALVNLFDYSGELVSQSIDRDNLKRQAVKMDGFMLFLDPTQLYGDRMGGVTLDRQIAALNEFMADMREARGIPVGQVIPVPVAVVIPKFDLLLTENPIQGQCVPFIREILREMNPPPKQTTLGTIEGRSAVVEEMLELMFRGVDIRGLVESYFGGQIMFFPVSSVSLFENELGIKDLSKRTIAPFGVAEPFLWLLHMHGYEMFA